jgi:hypothetical protein
LGDRFQELRLKFRRNLEGFVRIADKYSDNGALGQGDHPPRTILPPTTVPVVSCIGAMIRRRIGVRTVKPNVSAPLWPIPETGVALKKGSTLGGDNHPVRYNDNHPGRWFVVEGGVAAVDDEPPAAPSWWGFRMADHSLKKRSAPCQEPELLTNRFIYI